MFYLMLVTLSVLATLRFGLIVLAVHLLKGVNCLYVGTFIMDAFAHKREEALGVREDSGMNV